VSHILKENLDYSVLEKEDGGDDIMWRAKFKRCSLGTHKELDSAGKCRGTVSHTISGEYSNQLLNPVNTVAILKGWYPRTSFRRQGEM